MKRKFMNEETLNRFIEAGKKLNMPDIDTDIDKNGNIVGVKPKPYKVVPKKIKH